MLILTRKAGTSFVVNDNIRITVIKVGRSGVKIGINAPRCFSIVRGELEKGDTPNVVDQQPPKKKNGHVINGHSIPRITDQRSENRSA